MKNWEKSTQVPCTSVKEENCHNKIREVGPSFLGLRNASKRNLS